MFRYSNITFITVHSGGTVPMLVGRMKDRVPAPSQPTVNEVPGLKLPRQFELALLRGNAERLFPKFKLNTKET